MDLTSFMPDLERRIYKVAFRLEESTIKTFIPACSKENAIYLLEHGIKRKSPDSNFKILAIEDISQKHKKVI